MEQNPKFAECLQEIIGYINENQVEAVGEEKQLESALEAGSEANYTKVDFEDI